MASKVYFRRDTGVQLHKVSVEHQVMGSDFAYVLAHDCALAISESRSRAEIHDWMKSVSKDKLFAMVRFFLLCYGPIDHSPPSISSYDDLGEAYLSMAEDRVRELMPYLFEIVPEDQRK